MLCLRGFELYSRGVPLILLEPIDQRYQVFNLRRALKLLLHEQLPTVDRTLHFDRFFSLTLEKNKDARNGGETHENEAILGGSRCLVSMYFCLIFLICNSGHRLPDSLYH